MATASQPFDARQLGRRPGGRGHGRGHGHPVVALGVDGSRRRCGATFHHQVVPLDGGHASEGPHQPDGALEPVRLLDPQLAHIAGSRVGPSATRAATARIGTSSREGISDGVDRGAAQTRERRR